MATKAVDKMKYPDTNEEIDVLNYHKLIIKVYKAMCLKYGTWLERHKEDLVQSGYIGLVKAKEKYTPGRGSFLGLAYLRIMSAMQGDIARHAKYDVNTTPLESFGPKHDAKSPDGTERLSWEETFSGNILDYEVVLRFITDEEDKAVLFGIIEMYPYWKLRNILKETKEEHESRVVRIKQELRELLEILHPIN